MVLFLPRRLALFARPTTVVVGLTLATGLLFTFSRSAWIGLAFALVTALVDTAPAIGERHRSEPPLRRGRRAGHRRHRGVATSASWPTGRRRRGGVG